MKHINLKLKLEAMRGNRLRKKVLKYCLDKKTGILWLDKIFPKSNEFSGDININGILVNGDFTISHIKVNKDLIMCGANVKGNVYQGDYLNVKGDLYYDSKSLNVKGQKVDDSDAIVRKVG